MSCDLAQPPRGSFLIHKRLGTNLVESSKKSVACPVRQHKHRQRVKEETAAYAMTHVHLKRFTPTVYSFPSQSIE